MPAKRTSKASPSTKPRTSLAMPEGKTLGELREAAEGCRACPLWKPATQTVFGEGPDDARILMVGEQPGDEEDRSGHPFVGPSGKLLDRALEELGIDRGRTYVTNAVKHFKFELRGKRRLHKSPDRSEQRACRPWLAAEIDRLKPHTIVCLGAIAAQAVFGPSFRLMANRGRWLPLEGGGRAFATVHPSFVIRQRDPDSRARAYAAFVEDLALLKG